MTFCSPSGKDAEPKGPISDASSSCACRYPNCDARAETEDLLAHHAHEAHPCWCRVCHRSFGTERERAAHQARAHGMDDTLEGAARLAGPPESDRELEAIRTCCKVLAPVSTAGRLRVLDYLAQRFVVDAVDAIESDPDNHTAVTLLAAPGPSQDLVAADAVPFGKQGR
jgi:hypothetical protein